MDDNRWTIPETVLLILADLGDTHSPYLYPLGLSGPPWMGAVCDEPPLAWEAENDSLGVVLMPRPPKTSRDCFLCCKDCPDRYTACSAHCERYAAGKAEKERIDTARYEATRWSRRYVGGHYHQTRKEHRK